MSDATDEENQCEDCGDPGRDLGNGIILCNDCIDQRQIPAEQVRWSE